MTALLLLLVLSSPPVVTILSPTEGASVPAGSFMARARALDDEEVVLVRARIAPGAWTQCQPTGCDAVYTCPLFKLPEPQTIVVEAFDANGESAQDSVEVQ